MNINMNRHTYIIRCLHTLSSKKNLTFPNNIFQKIDNMNVTNNLINKGTSYVRIWIYGLTSILDLI